MEILCEIEARPEQREGAADPPAEAPGEIPNAARPLQTEGEEHA
jgi:hypothetical protein